MTINTIQVLGRENTPIYRPDAPIRQLPRTLGPGGAPEGCLRSSTIR